MINTVFAQNIDPSKIKNINLFLGINKELQLDFAADPRQGITIANETVVGYQYIQNKKEIVLIPKKAGTSRPKSKSTISKKAYANMKKGFPKKKK